jgi:hypothetical protein
VEILNEPVPVKVNGSAVHTDHTFSMFDESRVRSISGPITIFTVRHDNSRIGFLPSSTTVERKQGVVVVDCEACPEVFESRLSDARLAVNISDE